jgi:hypothetical protein
MLSLVYLLLVRLIGVLGRGRRVRQLGLENAVLRHQRDQPDVAPVLPGLSVHPPHDEGNLGPVRG